MTYSEKLAHIKYKNNQHSKFYKIEQDLREFDNTEQAKEQDKIRR